MAGKNTSTTVQKSLAKIRPAWISRVGQEMARGMEIRADFEEQLARFYDLLVQSVTTGDPGWPAYDLARRATMRFDTTSEVVDDPRAAVRDLWDGVR